MATNFFDRQDHARRQTFWLLMMFVASVVAIILAIYIVLAVAMNAAEPMQFLTGTEGSSRGYERIPGTAKWPGGETPGVKTLFRPALWQPKLFLWVTLGTTAVVLLASLYKMAELSAGGESIALMLGGRAVSPQTTDLAERRLLNVLEEMALASGAPVPPVYVLDHESGINAFAAGHQPGDAVVAVSGGCLQYLTREELQGVIGHEFSHILNGDMRLNLRLIGIVYGILVLAIIGYYCMRSAGAVSPRSSRRGDSTAAIFFVGVVLLIFGYLGVFFGKLIKAAINRQREFLADASSVQFTRNPGGIAGALKKIGGLTVGSRIHDAHAEEVSHMFFGDAFAGSFFNLFATHPPLDRRIRALEPEFDGRFPVVRPLAAAAEATVEGPRVSTRPAPRVPLPFPAILPTGAAAAGATMALNAGDVVERIGQPQAEQLQQAGEMLAAIPQTLLEAAHEPFNAQVVIYALLLSRGDDATRTQQMELLQQNIAPSLYQELQQLAGAIQGLPAAARLPLIDLSIPALKRSSSQQYGQFRGVVDALVGADRKVDLFEYCLRMALFSYLDVHFGQKKPPVMRYRTINAVAQPMSIVLSTLAYVGHEQSAAAERAFQAAAESLSDKILFVSQQQCTLQSFDKALAVLAQCTPPVKRRIIHSMTACIAADGQATIEERELLRAVAAVLACPLPPIGA